MCIYNRWKRKGSATAAIRPKYINKSCLVEGCTLPKHSKGYCSKHSFRFTRHGDASICNRHFWKDDIHKNLYHNAKYRAKKNGIVFTIVPEDIVVPEKCPILGISLTVAHGKEQTDNSPSLDRIINNKGYTKDNIQVISLLANRIKSNATKEQIKKVAEYLYTIEAFYSE